MKKVVGIGACVLDTIIQIDSYPLEDSKHRADDSFSCGGGPTSTALVCIAKLGVEAEYLGTVSGDSYGKQLIDEFKRYGVQCNNVNINYNVKAFTSYILLSKESGSRTVVFDKGNIPDEPKQVNLERVLTADILHLDGNYLNTAIAAAKLAKEHNVLVSLDAGSAYPNIEKLVPFVDILIPSEDFALKFTGKKTVDEAILALYKKYQPKVLVVTQGSKGGTYIENGKIHHYDAFKIKCVDSNGAGDTFHGAFLVAYLLGKNLQECIRFASATSAIKCQKAGVRTALPNMQEVEAFLKTRR